MLTKVVQGAEQKLAGRDGIEGFMLNVLEELNGVDLNAILNGLLLCGAIHYLYETYIVPSSEIKIFYLSYS